MDEDWAECIRLLEPMASDVVRIGGSGAQREIVQDASRRPMRNGQVARHMPCWINGFIAAPRRVTRAWQDSRLKRGAMIARGPGWGRYRTN
jgi:hypothetical protein